MNTGGPASEKTLLDEFAGQALPWCLGEFAGNPEDGTQYAEAAYQIASAMLAEKSRREGVSEIAPKDSDNRVIRVGWSLFSIADEALDSNDESRCFLHDWKEAVKGHREAVVQESSTTQYAANMAKLQAANRELVEALEKFMEAGFGFSTSPAMRSEAYNKACEALAKHKGDA